MTESERKKREAQTADAFDALGQLKTYVDAVERGEAQFTKAEWEVIAANAGTLQRRARLLAGLGRGG